MTRNQIEEKLKLKTSRRKEIIKLKADINKTENRKTVRENQQNQKLLEKISKTDNLLVKLSNKDTTVNIRKE